MIELLIVVMIIGILAKVAVPQYFKLVEKGKTNEAVSALESVAGAQERYKAKYGAYCTGAIAGCTAFDITLPPFKYFNALTTLSAGAGTPSWKATVTRNGNPAVYGAYVITYDIEPGAPAKMTCSNTNCSAELLPSIH